MSIESRPTASSETAPLDSARRVKPIHPVVNEVKLPNSVTTDQPGQTAEIAADANGKPISLASSTLLNPVTLKPFTIEELRSHNLEALVKQYSTPEAAQKAREDSVKELRRLLDENDRKTRDIKAQMDEKEKTREIERKVYARKLGKDG